MQILFASKHVDFSNRMDTASNATEKGNTWNAGIWCFSFNAMRLSLIFIATLLFPNCLKILTFNFTKQKGMRSTTHQTLFYYWYPIVPGINNEQCLWSAGDVTVHMSSIKVHDTSDAVSRSPWNVTSQSSDHIFQPDAAIVTSWSEEYWRVPSAHGCLEVSPPTLLCHSDVTSVLQPEVGWGAALG